jgi:hypothetical protein
VWALPKLVSEQNLSMIVALCFKLKRTFVSLTRIGEIASRREPARTVLEHTAIRKQQTPLTRIAVMPNLKTSK